MTPSKAFGLGLLVGIPVGAAAATLLSGGRNNKKLSVKADPQVEISDGSLKIHSTDGFQGSYDNVDTLKPAGTALAEPCAAGKTVEYEYDTEQGSDNRDLSPAANEPLHLVLKYGGFMIAVTTTAQHRALTIHDQGSRKFRRDGNTGKHVKHENDAALEEIKRVTAGQTQTLPLPKNHYKIRIHYS